MVYSRSSTKPVGGAGDAALENAAAGDAMARRTSAGASSSLPWRSILLWLGTRGSRSGALLRQVCGQLVMARGGLGGKELQRAEARFAPSALLAAAAPRSGQFLLCLPPRLPRTPVGPGAQRGGTRARAPAPAQLTNTHQPRATRPSAPPAPTPIAWLRSCELSSP